MTLEEFYQKYIPVETKRIAVDLNYISNFSVLINEGFYPVEALLIMKHDLQVTLKRPAIKLELATENNNLRLGDIAKKAHIYNHFYCDPHIEKITAKRFFREWGRNLIDRNQEVFVIKQESKIIGFLGYYNEGTNARIDLFAIDPKYQGQHFGERMLNTFLLYCKKHKYTAVIAGTSSLNIAVLGLYRKCGFKLDNVQMTLHKLRGEIK